MLVLPISLSLALFAPFRHGRSLSQTPVGKYPPSTDVQDHANIDLDQQAMESAIGGLSADDVTAVKAIYEGGAYSKPYFECTIASAGVAVADGASISYTDSDALTPVVRAGTADLAATLALGASGTLKVTYPKPFSDSTDPTISEVRVDGTKSLSITGGAVIGTCTAGTVKNKGGRTLKGFSTKVKQYMITPRPATQTSGGCPGADSTKSYRMGCPYSSAQPYYTYHCATAKTTAGSCSVLGDYANKYVMAALDTTATDFDNFNIDFSRAPANDATLRKDFIKKTTAYSNAWMYAIREFEDAIDDCTIGNLAANALSSGPVHAWDEGVAFYVGSLLTFDMFYDAVSGEEKAPPSKKLAYTLANKRCQNFKTCGRNGDMVAGEAYVNFELWKAFSDGKDALLTGNCAGLVPIKNKIVQLMTVPLIQGSLRYSWYCRTGASCSAKQVGELAAFATAVVPQVHACSASAAALIATAANPNSFTCESATVCRSTVTDFGAIKAAFESCYTNLGATCKMVGGLYDSANQAWNDPLTAPCSDASTTVVTNDELGTPAIAGIAVGAGAAVLLLICLLMMISKEKAGKPMFTTVK